MVNEADLAEHDRIENAKQCPAVAVDPYRCTLRKGHHGPHVCDWGSPAPSSRDLIAAAPDLYAALKGLLSEDGQFVKGTSSLIVAANVAIAKAEGRR